MKQDTVQRQQHLSETTWETLVEHYKELAARAEEERDEWKQRAMQSEQGRQALRAECEALRKVDDAMVERALVAWFDEPGCPEEINSWGKVQKDSVDGGAALRVFMREALTAARAVQPTTGGADE